MQHRRIAITAHWQEATSSCMCIQPVDTHHVGRPPAELSPTSNFMQQPSSFCGSNVHTMGTPPTTIFIATHDVHNGQPTRLRVCGSIRRQPDRNDLPQHRGIVLIHMFRAWLQIGPEYHLLFHVLDYGMYQLRQGGRMRRQAKRSAALPVCLQFACPAGSRNALQNTVRRLPWLQCYAGPAI